MTKQEVVKMFALITTAYPRSDAFKKISAEAVEMWQTCLEDVPFNVAQSALVAHSVNSEYPPSIAEIRRAALKSVTDGRDTAEEAWSQVFKAIRNSAYNSVEEYAKLPEISKRCIGSAAVLKEWAVSEDESTISVARAQFLNAYRTLDKREQERAMLPPAVRAALDAAMSDDALLLSEGGTV